MRVAYRGKWRNLLTVGKGSAYSHSDVLSAWESISNAAPENPYLIAVAPGMYSKTGSRILSGKTDVAIAGEGRLAAIVRRTLAGGGEVGGGTMQIGSSADYTARVSVENLRIVNELDGQTGGAAPEAALYVGQESVYPTYLNWDDVRVSRCWIEGVHDGLQIHGQAAAADGGPAVSGLLVVQGNRIVSAHDAYTIKGSMRVLSQRNQIHADSRGVQPYLTTIAGWKTTGIHFSPVFGALSSGPRGDGAWCLFQGESITVEGGLWTSGPPAFAAHAGVYLYGALVTPCWRTRFEDCRISVVWDHNATPAYVAGVAAVQEAQIPDGELLFNRCSIRVDQKNTGGSAPPNVAAVLSSHTGGGATSSTRLYHCTLRATNAKSGGTAYAIRTENAADTVRHGDCRSSDSTLQVAGSIIRELPL